MDLGLKGHIALVTAASRGLGFATARALSREGAKVAICARNRAPLEEAARRIYDETGGEVLPIVADVARPDDVQRLAEVTLAHFGHIDALFINAGGPPAGYFLDLTPEDWEKAAQLTLHSAIRLAYAVVPGMKARGSGSILANTSISVRHPLDGLILSNSLRAAVVALMKSLSIELGPFGIRANAIAPGWTRTERVDSLLQARADRNNTTPDEEMQRITGAIPLHRMASPEEFGRVAAFLLSPAASYISGVTLSVDGGMTRALL